MPWAVVTDITDAVTIQITLSAAHLAGAEVAEIAHAIVVQI